MKFTLVKLILLFALFWFSTGVNASFSSGPYNSNFLVENGIPPQLLDMPLHFFDQGVDVILDAFVVTPTFGYTFNSWRLRVLAGGQYQDYDTTIKGSAGSLGNFEVSQSTDKWAGMLGVQKEFLRNWDASLMVGKGSTRTSATLVVGYRF